MKTMDMKGTGRLMRPAIGGLAAGMFLSACLLLAGRVEAADYHVSDEASCLTFASAVGSSAYWNGDMCVLDGGTLGAADRLFVSGESCIRIQTGTFTNHGTIEINATGEGRGYYGAGTFVNRGRFEIVTAYHPDNYTTIVNRGTFITAVPMYNGGTISNICRATLAGTITENPVVNECLDPIYPMASNARKCQETIAKLGSKYFAVRHKALVRCRNALLEGKPVFQGAVTTVPVTDADECPMESTAAGKIAKVRQQVRKGLDGACNDALLGTLGACGGTIDALAGTNGSTGCLIESIDEQVADLIAAEYGY